MKRVVPKLRWVLCCLLTALLTTAVRAGEDVNIVKMLAAAQKTLMGSFPSGAMTAIVDDRYMLRKAEASVVWENDSYFCDARQRSFRLRQIDHRRKFDLSIFAKRIARTTIFLVLHSCSVLLIIEHPAGSNFGSLRESSGFR